MNPIILYILGAGIIILVTRKVKQKNVESGFVEDYDLKPAGTKATPLFSTQETLNEGGDNELADLFDDKPSRPSGPLTEGQKSFWSILGRGVDIFTGGIVSVAKEVVTSVKAVIPEKTSAPVKTFWSSYTDRGNGGNGSDDSGSEDRGGTSSSGFGSGGDDPEEEDRGGSYF